LFEELGPERPSLLRFVCTDMWQAYLLVVAEKAGQALNVLDRFQIMSHMNKAMDKVRVQEVQNLKAKGTEPRLPHSLVCPLPISPDPSNPPPPAFSRKKV